MSLDFINIISYLNYPTTLHMKDIGVMWGSRFFSQFCDVLEMAITHKKFFPDLVSYYIWKKKSKVFLYLWLPTGIHHKNLMIRNFFPSKFDEFEKMKTPLYRSKSYFLVEIIVLPYPKTLQKKKIRYLITICDFFQSNQDMQEW